MLEKVKVFLSSIGINEHVTAYDGEILALIDAGVDDMIESGISSDVIQAAGASVIKTLSLYIKWHVTDDEKLSERYRVMYEKAVFRLSVNVPG